MISIRRIQMGETELYRTLRLKALKEAPEAFCTSYDSALQRSEQSWLEQAEGAVDGPSRAIFFAFKDSYPIGMSAVYCYPDHVDVAELLQVWLDPDYRGQGVMNALMDTLSAWASKEGYLRLLATVKLTNTAALKFYQKYGFEESDRFSSKQSDQLILGKRI